MVLAPEDRSFATFFQAACNLVFSGLHQVHGHVERGVHPGRDGLEPAPLPREELPGPGTHADSAHKVNKIINFKHVTLAQVCKIQEVLGSPSPSEVEFIKNDKARDFLVGLPKRPRVAWQRLYPRAAAGEVCPGRE